MTSHATRLIRGAEGAPASLAPSVVTIGNFDGVHQAHRYMLDLVKAEARARAATSAVLTFEPTPQEFFARGNAPARLTTLTEKHLLFAELGVGCHVVQRFGARLATLLPEVFVRRLLVDGLGVKLLVVGHDFRFGRERGGDVELLRAEGRRHGYEVRLIEARYLGDKRISSTGVRSALAADDFAHARELLGRPYTMSGRVLPGERLGRTLGYPTANIRPRRRVLPLEGIFAVRVSDGGGLDRHAGVASLGTRPTVGGSGHLLEVHLFEFQGNLYGRRLRVEFVAKLRDEEHFDSVEALTRQMHRDAADARKALRIKN